MKPADDNGSEDAVENTHDTTGSSGSGSTPSNGNTLVVYSAVDEKNRQELPVKYAYSLFRLAQITYQQ